MAGGYAKLSASIITSSVWCEDDKTFRAWIALLAMADAQGHVDGSVPGLARILACSVEEARNCLDKLMAPDPYSRTPDHDGRRVLEEPGGWFVVNYQLYRGQCQTKDGSRAEYFRNYRRGKKGGTRE